MGAISIIIITYNRPGDTLSLLRDLRALRHPHLLQEIILLNNASTADYSPVSEYISNQAGWPCRLLEAPGNLGVSKGRNFAAAQATGDILFFIDDDTAVEDGDLLQRLATAFNRGEHDRRHLGVVAAKVRYTANRAMQVNAFPHKKFAERQALAWFPTYYYVGCAHAFTRRCWEKAGPNPEDFFYGMEEYDVSYRVLATGFYIAYDASIEVFHRESPEGRTPRAAQLRMMWVNKSVVAWRYLPRRYFLSTAVIWSFFFLKRSGLNLGQWWTGWKQVLAIPRRAMRRPVDAATRVYLREVQARLWF